jgi:hypothetical protein
MLANGGAFLGRPPAPPTKTTLMTKHRTPLTWLQEGRADRLPTAISDAFDDHIAALPWAGTTGLAWSRMPPSREFNVVRRSAADVYAWVTTVGLGRRSHIAVWYSRREGGIVVPLQTGAEALDELYWDAPGPRFAFGAEIESGVVEPFFMDVLQYGYGDLLVATALAS